MLVRIKNHDAFKRCVFGGDSFIEHFPDILTNGIEVKKLSNGYHYVMIDGKLASDTAFFTEEEMQYLEQVIQ